MLEIGQSAGKLKTYAYILGTYLGDGCAFYNKANRSYLYILNTIDEDFAERVKLSLETLLDKPARVKMIPAKGNRKPVYRVEIHSKDLCLKLRHDTFDRMMLPPEVYQWDDDSKKALITGIFDSDGWFAKSTLPTGKAVYQLGVAKGYLYIKELGALLKTVGIDAGKTNHVKRPHKDSRPILRIIVNKRSWIDAGMKFTAHRKQSRVNEYVAATSETICRAHKAKI